jgi:hypothetical protein
MSMTGLSNHPLALAALACVALSSCVFDDFLDHRRQLALRAEFQTLGERCVRVKRFYAGTGDCLVAAGYKPLLAPTQNPGERRATARRCVGASCGWIQITIDLNGMVLRWEVGSSGKPGLPSNALN